MKTKLFILFGSIFVLFIAFRRPAGEPPPEGNPAGLDINPPKVLQMWVQQLANPLPDGSNMKLMVKYEELDALPGSLDVFTSPDNKITFNDNGTGADTVSGDSVYSAYIAEDIPNFLSTIQDRIDAVNSKPVLLKFTGHAGVDATGHNAVFDRPAFDANKPVNIDPFLMAGWQCDWDLVKQNSLFITDTKVVNDASKTCNVVAGTGTPTGLWTFGNIMKNMAGTSVTPRDLMKSWVKHWMYDETVNGQNVSSRKEALTFLIQPWIGLARGNTSISISDLNWEAEWDATNENDLLNKAPFKLTAIVNRQDLRGNTAYYTTANGPGETRFIFTLENTHNIDGSNTAGNPPLQGNNGFQSTDPLLDWSGMNVIFEFGNVQTTICQIRDFSKRWLNLTNDTLGGTGYNDSLANITRTVIDAHAMPGKINGSAINRIRTNEKVFYKGCKSCWDKQFWEFRQFELDINGLLKQVPLFNTPMNTANNPTLLTPLYSSNPTDQNNLIDWAFSWNAKGHVHDGTHVMPVGYNNQPLLAGAATIDGGYPHYWNLNWDASTTFYNNTNIGSSLVYPYYQEMRRQLSLNTCQGCHAAETHTFFTHVRPIGYSESANYWTSPPDCVHGQMDTRFDKHFGQMCNLDSAYPVPKYGYFPKVSAFLTGRNYSGAGTYDDDNNSDTNDATMDGLFYINSPNNYDNILNPCNMVHGYNDLERRKEDLCAIIGTDCSLTTLNVFQQISFMPFPPASH